MYCYGSIIASNTRQNGLLVRIPDLYIRKIIIFQSLYKIQRKPDTVINYFKQKGYIVCDSNRYQKQNGGHVTSTGVSCNLS